MNHITFGFFSCSGLRLGLMNATSFISFPLNLDDVKQFPDKSFIPTDFFMEENK